MGAARKVRNRADEGPVQPCGGGRSLGGTGARWGEKSNTRWCETLGIPAGPEWWGQL